MLPGHSLLPLAGEAAPQGWMRVVQPKEQTLP